MEILNGEKYFNYNKHLEGLVNSSNGGIVVAASNLNLSKWTGELFYFKQFDENFDMRNADSNLQLNTNITSLINIENDKLITSTVSGSVMLFVLNDLDEDYSTIYCLDECNNHDSIIHSISVNFDYTKLISTGLDRSISIYDLNTFKPIGSYVAHMNEVIAGSFLPLESDLFVTADMNNRFILWDIRKSKPAQKIELDFMTSIVSSIAFDPSKTGLLAIGTDEGHLLTTDIRKPFLISTSSPHSLIVSKILFKPNSCDYVATCGLDSKVAVTNISKTNGEIIYYDVKHEDYVRGLLWKDDCLLSCSWDGKIASRAIQFQNGHK